MLWRTYPTIAVVLLSLSLLLYIPAQYVAVTSLYFIPGLKVNNNRENPQLPYKRTLVFGLSHHGSALHCLYPSPPSKLGTVPSDCPVVDT